MPLRPPSILRGRPCDILRSLSISSRSRARPAPISTPSTRSITTASTTLTKLTTYTHRPRIPTPTPTFYTSTTCIRHHSELTPPKPGEELHVTFTTKDGHTFTFEVAEGDNLLDIGQAHDLEMEGACGGSCACSTCHVIVEDQEVYDKLEEPDDDENDMLDLAFGLTETYVHPPYLSSILSPLPYLLTLLVITDVGMLMVGCVCRSRLGCQVKMRKDIDGLRVRLPSMTRNMQLSDFK
ncbi:Adrenodoxin [Drechslerella dactyloides]|uniref:Adrenodoxin n=1 Tax=Drechslerella dactyloides TaxID=74499 RepID=A0AAD6IQI3_DREDA|nr:Adrenodoxin [Drechslerella dactyloides]